MANLLSSRDRALQSRDAIDLLSSKWRITILHVLRDGPLRTNVLQAAISEISPKVLTQTLRGMERDGLIDRHIYNVVPPRVEYALTDMGAASSSRSRTCVIGPRRTSLSATLPARNLTSRRRPRSLPARTGLLDR